MQYDVMEFGWRTENGVGAGMSTASTNSSSRLYGVSFEPQSDTSISAIRFLGSIDGSPTNANHKCYITESIAGKLYHLATVSAANDTLTLTNFHGVEVNDRVVLFGATMPTGITRGDVYWVVNVATNDIKISTTQGGTAIDLTDTGTNVCVAKYADHSVLTTVTTTETTRRWLDYASFNGNTLSREKVYYMMLLNLEPTPGIDYYFYYVYTSFDSWNVSQYTSNLTTLTRSYTTSRLQHRITYANGMVDDFLFGVGSNSNQLVNNNNKIANICKNNTATKLYIRSVRINGFFGYSNSNAKDARYVCTIRDKATKDILATSIPLKPYNVATPGTANQYFLFEFDSAFEWAVNQEILVLIEYLSGSDGSLYVYHISWDANYYQGVAALYKRRGRTDNLIFQGGMYYIGTTWTEQLARHYFLSLALTTENPTGNVGGGSTETIIGF